MEKALCFSSRGLPGISLQLSRILHLVEKHAFFETNVSDFLILKIFIERRKSIIESEESSDEEVVSFRRKVICRISSSPESDTNLMQVKTLTTCWNNLLWMKKKN